MSTFLRSISLLALASLALAARAQSNGQPNILLGKAVSGNGAFQGADLSSITDGVFLPKSTSATQGAYWQNTTANTLTIDLNGTFTIAQLTGQFDDNDAYLVEYRGIDGVFRTAWNVPNVNPTNSTSVFGLYTRPNADDNTARFTLASPVTATGLRISAVSGDSFYSVSELQAFQAVPEPGTWAALGFGALGLLKRRKR